MFHILILFSLLITSPVSCAATTNKAMIKVIATDADGVIWSANTMAWAKLALYYPFRAVQLWFNKNFVCDIKALQAPTGLCDKSGYRIIGGPATVAYLTAAYMPWATQLDKMRMLSTMGAVTPIDAVIDFYQSLDMPIVVWTNNDQVTYDAKLKTVNALRTKAGKLPFHPNMEFVSIPTGKVGAKERSNVKPYPEYYKKAYEDTCRFFNVKPGELMIFFVDDCDAFVEGARAAAKIYDLPIRAYPVALKDSLEIDLMLFSPEMQSLVKELEESLHAYEESLALAKP